MGQGRVQEHACQAQMSGSPLKDFLLYFVYGWLVLWLVEAAVEVDGKVVNDINGFANCLIDFSLYSKHNQSSHIEQHG